MSMRPGMAEVNAAHPRADNESCDCRTVPLVSPPMVGYVSFGAMRRAALAVALIGAPQSTRAQAPPIGVYMVVDASTKKVLMAANAGKPRPVGSLTKIATACVVLDWAERTGADLGRRAVVPPSAASIVPNPFGFQPGDTISLRDALCCAMMGSDNIAAETLAWHVGADIQQRTGRSGTPFGIFKEMNRLAEFVGMRRTKFLNPHGLDNARAVPYSTAADMVRLTLYAQKKPAFGFYTSQSERRVSFYKGDSLQSFLLKNTNQLVGRSGIDGVKTGTTARAGQCLILSAAKKPIVVTTGPEQTQVYPRRLVAVVLGAQDRFRDGQWLLDQGWARYDQWVAAGRVVNDNSELLDPAKE
jgi:serine-type D-Ala-D-Ala carboxypeptidase (penicillin-binding protein 5/6)